VKIEKGFPANRPLPEFFVEWRSGFENIVEEEFGPIDYLNRDKGGFFTVAAQWLFCPLMVEYRGCIAVIKASDGVRGLLDSRAHNIDGWYAKFDGDVPKTEFMINLLNIPDLFASVDIAPFEDGLPELARSVAKCWESLARQQFPDRNIVAEVFDADDDSLGPEITLYTVPN
jgi:hypothetical protein